jgi:hypothetical protein
MLVWMLINGAAADFADADALVASLRGLVAWR